MTTLFTALVGAALALAMVFAALRSPESGACEPSGDLLVRLRKRRDRARRLLADLDAERELGRISAAEHQASRPRQVSELEAAEAELAAHRRSRLRSLGALRGGDGSRGPGGVGHGSPGAGERAAAGEAAGAAETAAEGESAAGASAEATTGARDEPPALDRVEALVRARRFGLDRGGI